MRGANFALAEAEAEIGRLKEGLRPFADEMFLVIDYGKPFTTAGFSGRVRAWCDAAGLPHCPAHGLRKAMSARLAERGATSHEIMSITGHQSLQKVERYTRAAGREKLADKAMSRAAGVPLRVRKVPVGQIAGEKP